MNFNEFSDHIRPYQVHNILKAYINKLVRHKEKPVNEQIRVPAKGKRHAVIEKVTDNIINKITRISFLNKRFYNLTERRRHEHQNFAQSKETQFVYHIIDKDNQKIRCRFSIKDSQHLIRKIENNSYLKSEEKIQK